MPRAKKPTAPAWSPPPGLKIEVGVSRGDLYFKAESTPAEAMNVARLLVAMARQVTEDAPDLLPVADSVPGAHQMMPGSEMWEEKAARPKVGFRAVG